MRKIFAIFVLSLVFSPKSDAYMYRGERLLEYARSFHIAKFQQPTASAQIKGSAYMGYISGMVDAFDGRLFCIPNSVEVWALGEVTLDYMEKDLSRINSPASDIVIAALGKTYPCRK